MTNAAIGIMHRRRACSQLQAALGSDPSRWLYLHGVQGARGIAVCAGTHEAHPPGLFAQIWLPPARPCFNRSAVGLALAFCRGGCRCLVGKASLRSRGPASTYSQARRLSSSGKGGWLPSLRSPRSSGPICQNRHLSLICKLTK